MATNEIKVTSNGRTWGASVFFLIQDSPMGTYTQFKRVKYRFFRKGLIHLLNTRTHSSIEDKISFMY